MTACPFDTTVPLTSPPKEAATFEPVVRLTAVRFWMVKLPPVAVNLNLSIVTVVGQLVPTQVCELWIDAEVVNGSFTRSC